MRKNLLTVLNYFGYFLYTPSCDEIYTFFPQKISKKSLKLLLKEEVRQNKLVTVSQIKLNNLTNLFYSLPMPYSLSPNPLSYTLPQYSIPRRHSERSEESNHPRHAKISFFRSFGLSPQDDRIKIYIYILKILPLVRFVGITGKSAMMGLRENDDLDLCIVAKHSFLWTTRFIVILLAKLLRIHTKNGVCLNLFFDESDLVIPKNKQNSYIGHELLQMKPIIDKDGVYGQFLCENEWIYRYFPNAESQIAKRVTRNAFRGSCIAKRKSFNNDIRYTLHEYVFKSLQLPLIHRNKTSLLITSTQLWLFKNDFEKKLKRRGLVI